jgi:ribonucleoside-diphosphate reductase alpha subunit
MFVVKRDGRKEQVKLEKISKRLSTACKGLKNTDPLIVAQKVINGLYDGVSTEELDKLACETAYAMSVKHPEYDTLATRLVISNQHKQTPSTFVEVIEKLHSTIDVWGNSKSLISDKVYKFVKKYGHVLDSTIDYSRDYLFDYFGYKTLERSYLLKVYDKDENGKVTKRIIERPQHMWMRVAIGIHSDDVEAAINTYHMLSTKKATHATPTLFNSGLVKNQLSSCFLIAMKDDSISGIYDTLTECALISQSSGGIGVHFHDIRSKGSPIYGTGGISNGIVPMLRNFNETARYVDQCFAENTIVYTKNGPKKISQVVVSDELISDTGDYNRVSKVIRSEHIGKMVSLKVKQAIEPILVKEEHPFLVLKNQNKGINFSVIKNRLDKNIIKPEWIEASELTTDDLIAFPICNYEKDIIEYSEDDCRFYGFMVGDGWVSKNNKEIRLFPNVNDDLNFLRSYLNNLNIKFSEYKKEKDSTSEEECIVFCFNMKSNFKFDRSMLYDNHDEKIIHTSMLHLSKEKTLQLIKGVMESDGHIGSKLLKEENGSNELILEMTSENVVQSIRYMLMRFGILSSGQRRNRIGDVSSYRNITTKKETFYLRVPKVKDITNLFGIDAGEYTTFFEHNNYVYSRVNKTELVNFEGTVYDFEVLPNHNYLTEIGIAHNGGGKRKGSFAMYLEPWHADVFDFLDLRKNTGKEELRCRDLNLALWAPDLFFKRVEADGDWTLMDPNKCKGLSDLVGEAFEEQYLKYESSGFGEKTIKARELWSAVVESQIETGQPYILAKDSCNKKSNQKNLGTIKSSNLCAEIIEHTDTEHTAVCNLASISLPSFVEGKKYKKTFNFDKLYEITKTLTENLNKIIDTEYYPVETARKSNLKDRPIGIGIQGLADVFALMRYSWDSEAAATLNKQIAETIYFAFLETSCELAKTEKPYPSYEGSPVSKGILQFEEWDVKPSDLWDWAALKKKIKKYGIRNSLGVALMPTASTSQILGNTECFEPITSNIYKRSTLSGEFIQINKYLVDDLIEQGLWSEDLRQKIISNNGSVQNIDEIPVEIKNLYKTVWELSQKIIINMAADRGPYVCQSQSMNLYIKDPNAAKLTSAIFHAWKRGLKTLVYYMRTNAAKDAVKITVEKEIENNSTSITNEEEINIEEGITCSLDNPESCEMCGS